MKATLHRPALSSHPLTHPKHGRLAPPEPQVPNLAGLAPPAAAARRPLHAIHRTAATAADRHRWHTPARLTPHSSLLLVHCLADTWRGRAAGRSGLLLLQGLCQGEVGVPLVVHDVACRVPNEHTRCTVCPWPKLARIWDVPPHGTGTETGRARRGQVMPTHLCCDCCHNL